MLSGDDDLDLYKNTEWDFLLISFKETLQSNLREGANFVPLGKWLFFVFFFAKMANSLKNRKNHVLVIKLASSDRKYDFCLVMSFSNNF